MSLYPKKTLLLLFKIVLRNYAYLPSTATTVCGVTNLLDICLTTVAIKSTTFRLLAQHSANCATYSSQLGFISELNRIMLKETKAMMKLSLFLLSFLQSQPSCSQHSFRNKLSIDYNAFHIYTVSAVSLKARCYLLDLRGEMHLQQHTGSFTTEYTIYNIN